MLSIWDLLHVAVREALHSNNLEEAYELLDYYPPLPPCPPLLCNPPMDIEPLPPLSTCEFNVHPPVPSCLDCIPGLAFCRNHERHCGDTHCIHCNFCGRLLCLAHLSCLCPSSVQGLSTGSVQGTRTLAKKPEKPENRENHEKPKTSEK